jgi:hypothetical protein
VKVTDCPNSEGFSEETIVVNESPMLTLCEIAGEVLPLKFPSPLVKTAVMSLWLPTESAVVVRVATPDPLRVPVPNDVATSKNCALPVGVPVPGATAVTVAVSVTDWPYVEELGDDVTTVDVLALLTT